VWHYTGPAYQICFGSAVIMIRIDSIGYPAMQELNGWLADLMGMVETAATFIVYQSMSANGVLREVKWQELSRQ
jgi:hypothetical protein